MSSKSRARLRTAGFVVLLLGIGGACILYWIRTRQPDLMDDPMMTGYSRPESRQMAILYGKMGQMVLDLTDDLKRPGVQAILIAGISALIAVACFFVAREPDDGPPGKS
jgi:hypothetical protein